MSQTLLNIDKYISGDSHRLFINLSLGCSSQCNYCYLPIEGLPLSSHSLGLNLIKAESLLELLENDSRFISGPNGTIISIGCFSECWDATIRSETIILIQGLLKYSNPIQFATKRRIDENDVKKITEHPKWNRQVVAYISSATITYWRDYEKGTTPPDFRFQSFKNCKSNGMNACLYIKPVLQGITIKDIEKYTSIVIAENVDVVVGDIFIEDQNQFHATPSPISDLLIVEHNSDCHYIKNSLSKVCNVYTNSTNHLLASIG